MANSSTENAANGGESGDLAVIFCDGEMVGLEDREQAGKLLASVWGADDGGNLDGVHFIASPTSDGAWQHFPVKTIGQAVDKALGLSGDGRNAYFACSEYVTGANRKSDNVRGARAFWLDIDCGAEKAAEGKGYATKRDAVNALKMFCTAVGLPIPNTIVNSGNGLHCYWTLGQFIDRETWRKLARKLKKLSAQHGLLADASRTSDIASVLRVPGTGNWKDQNAPKAVKVKLQAGHTDYESFENVLDAVDDRVPMAEAVLANVERHPPMQETPENVAKVRAMLAVIPASIDRVTWRNVLWAVADTGWNCAEALAREWSETSPKDFDQESFDKHFDSFDKGGGISYASLVYIARQHGYVEPDTIDGERFTGSGGDVKNGEIFAKTYRGKLLFVHETGDVLVFDPVQGWVIAPPGEEDRAAKAVLARMLDIAAEKYKSTPHDPKTKRLMAHVERTSKAPNLRAMVEMAKSEPGMTVRLGEFDNDQMLLGVTNGVLNLRTSELLPVSPDVLVSKRCNVAYDPSAKCPRFLQFMKEIQPESAMREFLQRACGYFLTGSVQEQKFLFMYGEGANGKSVIVESLSWLLGDYARKIATEMLMHHQRSPQGPSPDIVALKGCRFVYANETEEGRRLAEARVKDMTGGDTLTGRVPYGKADITFTPTHKLVVVGNHKPEITDNSFGMWRRVALTPFEVTIPEVRRDPRLLDSLKTEGAGILNWMLEGLRMWQNCGLAVPKKIEAATAAYREDQDVIGEWVSDQCHTGANCTERKASLYKAYRQWALDNGHHPLAQGRITRRLNERGYRLLADKRTVAGLKLKMTASIFAGGN